MNHVSLSKSELLDGTCECRVARTATLFLTPEDESVAYCDICKKQVLPNDRETVYNSHFTTNQGWVFIVMNSALDKIMATPSVTRMRLPEGHPDARWDSLLGDWVESDEALRKRILENK